jgi:hypothetical protein
LYKPKTPIIATLEVPPSTIYPTSKLKNKFTEWRRQKQQDLGGIQPIDELQIYLDSKTIKVQKPIEWWMENTQQSTYPNLSRMAIDILSIPAMAADPERLFSSAGWAVNNRRNRLEMETIQALESLKSWYKLEGIS